MKAIKLIVAFFVLAMAGAGSAWADHHSRIHFGLMIGPGWGPWYYPPPAYYYPPYYAPPIIVQPQPQVYVEQQPTVGAAPAAAASNYWYYCASEKGYYPYVKTCPGGWQKVAPRPEE